MRLRLARLFTIRQEGFVLRFHPSSLSAALWIDPADHQAEAAFLRRYLRPGDIVVDVGANIGLCTLAASRAVRDEGRVIALEPHPRIFSYLRENVALNHAGNVSMHNLALGDREGTLVLSDLRADDQNFVARGRDGIEIAVRRLDQLPLPDARIALVKIDVEGYERFVLEGAAATLSRTQCVHFESWDQHFARYGYGSADVVRLLSRRGFEVLRHDDQGTIRPITGDHASPEIENLVAVREIEHFVARTGFTLCRD
jgi:FkbM family methyltransferase